MREQYVQMTMNLPLTPEERVEKYEGARSALEDNYLLAATLLGLAVILFAKSVDASPLVTSGVLLAPIGAAAVGIKIGRRNLDNSHSTTPHENTIFNK